MQTTDLYKQKEICQTMIDFGCGYRHYLVAAWLTDKQDKVLSEEMTQVKYKDVFGETNKQKKVCQVFTKIMAAYEKNKRKDHQELP